MKNYKMMSVMAGCVAMMVLGSFTSTAQERPGRGRGDFDPEQFRQRMLDRVRENMEVKDDAEWKIIAGRIEKVMEARREVGFGGFGPGGPGFRGRGGPDGDGRGRGDRGRGGREADPNVEALREALDSGASAEDIKAKLAKVRADRQAKQKALEAAQADLRKVLSVKQEATAYLMGLVP